MTNEPNDKNRKVLEIVASAKWITHKQLWDIARIINLEKNDNVKVFEGRVRHLAESGLLRKQRPEFLRKAILYSITKSGIFRLETMGVHPLSLAFDRGDPDINHHVPHALEVNRIRIALLRSGTLTEWMEDSAIRVLRNAGNPDYAKIYDAVATITVDGELYRVGIEYERSLKAFERYQEIASRLADERRIQAVLYLCPNYETLRAISHVFVRAPKTVIVAIMDDFVENPLEGRVLVRLGMTTLRTELCRISRQTASGQNGTKIGLVKGP
jgi:hypothetical protein